MKCCDLEDSTIGQGGQTSQHHHHPTPFTPHHSTCHHPTTTKSLYSSSIYLFKFKNSKVVMTKLRWWTETQWCCAVVLGQIPPPP